MTHFHYSLFMFLPTNKMSKLLIVRIFRILYLYPMIYING